ncbi:MAG: hypothetical protein ACE14S_03115 [Candidatus Bathyarchaeia archaeon]
MNTDSSTPDFYLGVTAGGDVAETMKLIAEVKDFTNLLVITNLEVTKNKTSLEALADYAVDSGLSVMIYAVYPSPTANYTYNPIAWVQEAKERYGDRFVGYYLFDEPGGNQLDRGSFRQFDNTTKPHDYRDGTHTYIYYLYSQMRDFIETDKLFTSDYALFWFDYEAGYDTVLCHFGWNNSRPLNVALCRGAAEMHNKTWGVMMAWTYREPPYIEAAPALYRDMVDAYEAGANYVVVFNYPNNVTEHGLLNGEHLNAIRDFSRFVSENPRNRTSNTERVAYVLPENYGWGLRNPDDTIWGVWEADENSPTVWEGVTRFLQEYGYGFDVVVDSPWTRLFGKYHYDRLVWWNETQPSG